ncbi:uncharacterized protein LOC101861916 [Aplysia californica]|uniref:Uncharacterized protein LOC101861916 n=1 Tax=Aplysia californica TaxID=6500 RepID=A0ABM0K7M9_APLCA|nr:uncharacterized protein LOC101861916 [Aplysia californica]
MDASVSYNMSINPSVSQEPVSRGPHWALLVSETLFHVIINRLLSVFGIGSNIINITVFCKQGFKETITVGLVGLAISDFGTVVGGLVLAECFNPLMPYEEWRVKNREVQYLAGSFPRVCFARITGLITVYITLERCLCVAIPLHVKRMLKPKRTFVIVLFIYALVISTIMPVYVGYHLTWKFSPQDNATVFGLVMSQNAPQLEYITYIATVVLQMSSFILLILLTSALVIMLKKKSEWRKQTSSLSENKTTTSRRDRSAIRLVVMVACILIGFLTPGTVLFLTTIFEPHFNIGGDYEVHFYVAWTVVSFCEVANSSLNIFVYYNMNTKYRETFLSIFCLHKKKLESVTTSNKI